MSIKATERKARDRQLIQLGGLVVKSGLDKLLNVPTGGDMQKHYGAEAAILIGAFDVMVKQLSKDADGRQLAQLRKQGSAILNEKGEVK